MSYLQRLDRYQQAHGWLGFPFAVYRKFSEDRASNLAALIAYYAFLSVFPLLLVLVTALGFVLAGNPEWQRMVFSSALGQFPIIGQNGIADPLGGNPAALAMGLGLAVWSGLAVAHTTQTAFNTVYDIPRVDWPGLLPKLARSVKLVTVTGVGLILTTLLQGAVSGVDAYGLQLDTTFEIAAAAVGIGLNTVLFGYLFRQATARRLAWREVVTGAAVAAVAWFALQKLGTTLVNTRINGAQGTYGTFAAVIGLLFWFFVLAQITVLCAEINVVLAKHLWPRGLSTLSARASTDADRRAYQAYPQREHHAHNVDVTTHLHPDVETAAGAVESGAQPPIPPQRNREAPDAGQDPRTVARDQRGAR